MARRMWMVRSTRLALAAVVVGACLAWTGCGAFPRAGAIPVEALQDGSPGFLPKVSPDGRHLATLATRDGERRLIVRSLAWPRPPWMLRLHPGVSSFHWSSDSRSVLYRADRDGDERYHLYRLDIHTGRRRDLTPFAGTRTELLGFDVFTPERVVLTTNRRNPELADAYRVDPQWTRLEIAAQNPGHFIKYLADHRGHVLVAVSLAAPEQIRIHHRSDERAPWQVAATYPAGDFAWPLAFSDRPGWIYMESNRGSDRVRLVLLELATGVEEVVADDPAGRVDLDRALVDPATGRFIAARFVEDDVRWVSTDPSFLALLAILPPGASNMDVLSRSRDGARWTLVTSAPTSPRRYYLAEPGAKRMQLLFGRYPELGRFSLAPTRPIRVRARDGLELPGYLTLPVGKADHPPYPTVLWVHGGPWSRDLWDFDELRLFFASRGYAVLSVNFRGSTGYGKRFFQMGRKGFAAAMQDDLLDAVDWAVTRGIADASRIAIAGGSYGGYAAVVGLAFTPDRFACGIDLAGPVDLVDLIESFPANWRLSLGLRWYSHVGDPRVPADRADLARRSPIHRADAIHAPLLIFQGANDPRVTRAHSDRLALHLHRRGVPVTYLLADRDGHSSVRDSWLPLLRATEVFLARCLGGRTGATTFHLERRLDEMTVDLDALQSAVGSRR